MQSCFRVINIYLVYLRLLNQEGILIISLLQQWGVISHARCCEEVIIVHYAAIWRNSWETKSLTFLGLKRSTKPFALGLQWTPVRTTYRNLGTGAYLPRIGWPTKVTLRTHWWLIHEVTKESSTISKELHDSFGSIQIIWDVWKNILCTFCLSPVTSGIKRTKHFIKGTSPVQHGGGRVKVWACFCFRIRTIYQHWWNPEFCS